MATPAKSSSSSASTTASNKKISTIVPKPFTTGEINFFLPFKNKTNPQREAKRSLAFDDELEEDTLPSPQLKWQTRQIFNVWNTSAIAIVLLTNLIALGVMRVRDAKPNSVEPQPPTIGNSDLTAKEFMPLNLSTISSLSSQETPEVKTDSKIVPDSLIPPAFAPFNNDTFTNKYHYVLAQYSGDRSLELARKQVDNISLIHLPQGMFIYLGAFTEEKPASDFVNRLKEVGIVGKIYPFEEN